MKTVEEYLTIVELASRLKLSPKTIYSYAEVASPTFESLLRSIVREEVQASLASHSGAEVHLLTAGELATKLSVPVSWVYEQSRLGKIPTHRIGRYVRFNLQDVLKAAESGRA